MVALRGGDKLEAHLKGMAEKLSGPNTVRIGFLEGATYPDGTPVAKIAAIQEFGAPRAGIPPRPFFRNMIAAKKGEWPKAVGDLLVANSYDVPKTLDLTGSKIKGQLQKSIIDTNAPPLKEATIIAKGGKHGTIYDPKNPSTFAAKPLVDTGVMFEKVGYEVTS